MVGRYPRACGAVVMHELARFSWPASCNMWRGAFWQALLANMAAMYAVYHGPEGLRTIANRVHGLAGVFSAGVSKLGLETGSAPFFDTVKVIVGEGQAEKVTKDAAAHGVNLRVYDSKSVSTKSYTVAAVCSFGCPVDFRRAFGVTFKTEGPTVCGGA